MNEDFQASQENLRLLAHQLDERDNEAIKLREEHSQAVTKSKQLERDNERFKQEITDMGRQVKRLFIYRLNPFYIVWIPIINKIENVFSCRVVDS